MFVSVSRMMTLVACYCLCYHPLEHVTAKYKSHDTSGKKQIFGSVLVSLLGSHIGHDCADCRDRQPRPQGLSSTQPTSLKETGKRLTLVMRLSEGFK